MGKIVGGYLIKRQQKYRCLLSKTQELPFIQSKQDKFFGTVTVYRQHLDIELPLQFHSPELNKLDLKVTFQGCADIGICYMPIEKTVAIDLATSSLLQSIGTLLQGK